MSKPRLCAKPQPKPRLMGCAPLGQKIERVSGEMSFAEFLIAMNKKDMDEEAKATTGQLIWANIMRQANGGL